MDFISVEKCSTNICNNTAASAAPYGYVVISFKMPYSSFRKAFKGHAEILQQNVFIISESQLDKALKEFYDRGS